jgi:hypothetical protein
MTVTLGFVQQDHPATTFVRPVEQRHHECDQANQDNGRQKDCGGDHSDPGPLTAPAVAAPKATASAARKAASIIAWT